MTGYAGGNLARMHMTFRLFWLTLAGISPHIYGVGFLTEVETHCHRPHFFLQCIFKIVRLRLIEKCWAGLGN